MWVNKSKVAWKYLPLRFFYTTAILWSLEYMKKSGWHVGGFFKGWGEIIRIPRIGEAVAGRAGLPGLSAAGEGEAILLDKKNPYKVGAFFIIFTGGKFISDGLPFVHSSPVCGGRGVSMSGCAGCSRCMPYIVFDTVIAGDR